MFAFIRRMGCLAFIAFIIFVFLALQGGGSVIRDLGKKAGGVVEKATDYLAEEADKVQKKAEEAKKDFRKWTKKLDFLNGK